MRLPTLDVSAALRPDAGSGGVEPMGPDDRAALGAATEALAARRGTGWLRWRDLPFDPARAAHLGGVRGIAERVRGLENVVVLGIGGSALGTIAVQAALRPVTWNLQPADERGGPRLFVLDNADPHLVLPVLDLVEASDPRWDRSLVVVVSKSGETAETAAQLLIAWSRLRAARGEAARDRLVAVTDPRSGTLRGLADDHGLATLPVPDGVGGRFSVLSPVGLLPLALVGIDVEGLLDGAAAMDGPCADADPDANPAARLAWLLTAHARAGRRTHVLMPYGNRLAQLGDWFRQLWAESLGKRVDRDGNVVHAGATPVRALGATDQHSQIQLYREGPDDKVIGFVAVSKPGRDAQVPAALDADPLRYLHGHTLGELLDAERRATAYALRESERPTYTITLPALDAPSIGAFIQLWQVTTAYAGELLNIDAYDQPAVETGKRMTREYLAGS